MRIASVTPRRQPPDPLEVVVNDTVDNSQRVRAVFGRKLTQNEIDRVGKPHRVGPRGRALARTTERVAFASRGRLRTR